MIEKRNVVETQRTPCANCGSPSDCWCHGRALCARCARAQILQDDHPLSSEDYIKEASEGLKGVA